MSEYILHAAVKDTNGTIYLSRQHAECFVLIPRELFSQKAECQGFVTSTGRFVSRVEAAAIRLSLNDYEYSGFNSGAQWALSEVEKRSVEGYKEWCELPVDQKLNDSEAYSDWLSNLYPEEMNAFNKAAWNASAINSEKKHQAEIDRLKAERQKLVEVVKFYADPDSWDGLRYPYYNRIHESDMYQDLCPLEGVKDSVELGGKRARQVLKEIGGIGGVG